MHGNTRAAIMPMLAAMPIDEALAMINAHHARTPLSAEQVYVFRMILSTQAVDSYQTRMSESTLRNYARDFTEGRALMNSHRSGGWASSGELPVGRTFRASVEGTALPSDARYETPGGASLAVLSYIQRDLRITDVATNDLVRGIDGGTINAVSVGFLLGPDGMYRCALCGSDLMDYERCTHIPGAQYDNGRCFAWVENARGIEASLVYAGATPGAMIDKAIRMAETGHLARMDALRLEDEWGVRIVSGKPIVVAKPTAEAVGLTTESIGATPNEDKETSMPINWEEVLSGLRAVDATLADRVTALGEDERPGALVAIIREGRDQSGAQARLVADLTPRATLGDQYLDDLVKRAVAARVTAEGADAFDGEKYGKLLRGSNDPAFIQSEIKSHEAKARKVFGDGKRPTTAAKVAPIRPYRRA